MTIQLQIFNMHLSACGVDAHRIVVHFDIFMAYYKETSFGHQLYGWEIASARPLNARYCHDGAMWVAFLQSIGATVLRRDAR